MPSLSQPFGAGDGGSAKRDGSLGPGGTASGPNPSVPPYQKAAAMAGPPTMPAIPSSRARVLPRTRPSSKASTPTTMGATIANHSSSRVQAIG